MAQTAVVCAAQAAWTVAFAQDVVWLSMIFMLLIFIGIIVIVVWKIVDPKGLEDAGVDVPDQVVDPLSSSGRRLAAFRSLAAFGRAAPQSGSGSSIGAGGRFADR